MRLQITSVQGGWRQTNDAAKIEIRKEVVKKKKGRSKTWRQYKKTLKGVAGKVADTTKIDGDKAVKQTPTNARKREEAAARCTKATKR